MACPNHLPLAAELKAAHFDGDQSRPLSCASPCMTSGLPLFLPTDAARAGAGAKRPQADRVNCAKRCHHRRRQAAMALRGWSSRARSASGYQNTNSATQICRRFRLPWCEWGGAESRKTPLVERRPPYFTLRHSAIAIDADRPNENLYRTQAWSDQPGCHR